MPFSSSSAASRSRRIQSAPSARGDQERHGADHAVEFRQAARMGVGIALHQPARVEHLDREVVVLRDGAGGDRRASLSRCAISRLMAQRRAAHRLERGQHVEHQEPGDRARAHAPALLERRAEQLSDCASSQAPEPRPAGCRRLPPAADACIRWCRRSARRATAVLALHAFEAMLARVLRSATRITSS